MKSAKDPRHIARVLSVIDLYRIFFPLNELGEIGEINTDELEIGTYSKKLRESIVEGVKANFAEIDKIVNEYSEPVKVSDLDVIQLQIVRIAVFEGFFSRSVPPKVAVDEALELVRDFGIEVAVKKIAGILGKIFDNKVPKEISETKSDSSEDLTPAN